MSVRVRPGIPCADLRPKTHSAKPPRNRDGGRGPPECRMSSVEYRDRGPRDASDDAKPENSEARGEREKDTPRRISQSVRTPPRCEDERSIHRSATAAKASTGTRDEHSGTGRILGEPSARLLTLVHIVIKPRHPRYLPTFLPPGILALTTDSLWLRSIHSEDAKQHQRSFSTRQRAASRELRMHTSPPHKHNKTRTGSSRDSLGSEKSIPLGLRTLIKLRQGQRASGWICHMRTADKPTGLAARRFRGGRVDKHIGRYARLRVHDRIHGMVACAIARART